MALAFSDSIELVGKWSQKNFGDQKGAGALAPLAGIIEEFGELEVAWCSDEAVDAFCDQLVYLADVCYRAGVVLDVEWNSEYELGMAGDPQIPLGQLAHAILKRHQGIRGFDDDNKFRSLVQEGAKGLFYSINRDFNLHLLVNDDVDLADEYEQTLKKVLKRDWVENPDDANKVAEDAHD